MIASAPHERARVIAVIQARTGSTRFPRKVLQTLGDRPVLSWSIRAAQAAKEIDEVIVATSTASDDDAIEQLANDLGARCVRGSETDVLARYITALDASPADAVVRLTSDCPLLDPALIDEVAALWRRSPDTDYVSTVLWRSLPRGLDVELASAPALRAINETTEGYHPVHVTSALYAEDSAFRQAGVVFAPRADRFRVTLDAPADLAALAAIVAALGEGPYAWREVVALLEDRPDIVAMNSGVMQKKIAEG